MITSEHGQGDRWRRVREVFAAALERPPAERGAFVATGAAEDRELAAEVEALLAAHGRAEGFLEAEAGGPAGDPLEGSRIGPYRVLRCLGRGGMGAVYLALRADEEFRKRVALKVLKPGMDSAEVIRRFRTERQILAALDHPHIAKLLDGGTTEHGLPYFVMEHVEGQPIDRFCDDRRLSVPARLELFRRVCAAVQFAHQNLVIHRDLKPGNILVTADGTPKLLDFGIAKFLNPELSSQAAVPTALALQPMTPDYASPEQVRGEHITTASDVYALGVLLYELLTGHHPHRERAGSPEEMRRLITEVEPERPSAALKRSAVARAAPPSAADSRAAGRGRDLEITRLRRRLEGDLDNIVLMALRKQPGRRYPSVEQLSEDVRRHLEGLPVAARRGTAAYRLEKFVRRHRLGVAVAASLLLAVLAFGLAMAALAARLAHERDRAEQERSRAEQVTKFLVEVFEVSDPQRATGATVTAREVLDAGTAKLTAALRDEPQVRADLMATVGGIYRRLGLFDRAERLLEDALAARRQNPDTDGAAMAQTLNDLAILHEEKGEYRAARKLYEEALALRRRAFGERHPAVAQTLSDLGALLYLSGESSEAERLLRQAADLRRELLGEDHPDLAKTLNNLGIVFWARGQYAEAEPFLRQALEIRRRAYGPVHVEVADALANLALLAQAHEDFAAAEELCRQALELRRRLYDGDHPRLAANLNNLGFILQAIDRLEEAEAAHREALEMRRRLLGPRHPEVAQSLENLATVARARGDLPAAEHFLRQVVALRRELLGPAHPHLAQALRSLARVLVGLGQVVEAERLARESVAIFEQAQPRVAPQVAAGQVALGASLAAQGRFAEAEPLLLASLTALEAEPVDAAPSTQEALAELVALYEAWGKPARAAELRARLAPKR